MAKGKSAKDARRVGAAGKAPRDANAKPVKAAKAATSAGPTSAGPTSAGPTSAGRAAPLSDLLRLRPGAVDLSALDAGATPGFEDGDKDSGQAALTALDPRISELQERLYAHGRSGGQRRVLLICQGMDTSGKGGVMRYAVALMDPQGVSITSFKAPTAEELAHDFLWRIRKAVPGPGMVGVFDRSQYEDVLIGRVRKLVTPAVLGRRYGAINRFEADLAASGCVVLKVMLHISKDEQKARLAARLEDASKYWKYNPGDVDERVLWDDYQAAYALALERCNTAAAPWHLVPSDTKWYRNWAVATLLLEHLDGLDLGWPPPDFDVKAEQARVAAS